MRKSGRTLLEQVANYFPNAHTAWFVTDGMFASERSRGALLETRARARKLKTLEAGPRRKPRHFEDFRLALAQII